MTHKFQPLVGRSTFLLIALFCSALVQGFAETSTSSTVVRGRVVGVADGDTIRVLGEGKQLVRVRLAYIDAPEQTQPYSNLSKRALSELVFRRKVELRVQTTDHYGRLVAQVFVNGTDAGLELLRAGLAWVYERYITEAPAQVRTRYRQAASAAREQRLGLWRAENPVPPWRFRRRKQQPAAPVGPVSGSNVDTSRAGALVLLPAMQANGWPAPFLPTRLLAVPTRVAVLHSG